MAKLQQEVAELKSLMENHMGHGFDETPVAFEETMNHLINLEQRIQNEIMSDKTIGSLRKAVARWKQSYMEAAPQKKSRDAEMLTSAEYFLNKQNRRNK